MSPGINIPPDSNFKSQIGAFGFHQGASIAAENGPGRWTLDPLGPFSARICCSSLHRKTNLPQTAKVRFLLNHRSIRRPKKKLVVKENWWSESSFGQISLAQQPASPPPAGPRRRLRRARGHMLGWGHQDPSGPPKTNRTSGRRLSALSILVPLVCAWLGYPWGFVQICNGQKPYRR